MMNLRNTLATSAAVAALMTGASAHAGDYYLSLFGGLSTFDDEIPFQMSTYNPGITIPQHFVSRIPLTTVPLTFQFHTGLSSSILVTSRTIGYYRVFGDRYQSTQIYHDSYFAWEDDFENGFVVGAALGTSLGNNFRGELELAYRKYDVDGGGRVNRRINGTIYQDLDFYNASAYIYRYLAYNTFLNTFVPYTGTFASGFPVGTATSHITAQVATLPAGTITGPNLHFPNASSTIGAFNSGGDAQVWSMMANIWLDLDVFGLNPDGVTTFIGGGLGMAQLDLEYNASMGTHFGGSIGYSLDDSGMGFAYQLGAGIGFDMGNGMMLSAQYRWFGTSDVDLGNTDMRVESHNAIISLSVPLGNLSM